jgi:O-methyltransferase
MKNFLSRLFGFTYATNEAPDNNETISKLISDVRQAHLTYCGPPKLENLRDGVLRVVSENVRGDFIEAGVALGGSAILLAQLKPSNSALRLYDVFGMIPAPGPNDGEDAHRRYEVIKSGISEGLGGKTYYGYQNDLIESVRKNLAQFGFTETGNNIHLVQGLFEDALHPPGAVAFAHIDCDWYEPVKTCIDRIMPKLSPGGIMVFDDYSSYSGCTRAVDELLAGSNELEVVFHKRSLGIRRKP